MKSTAKSQKVLVNEQEPCLTPVEFTLIGIACHALCLIDHLGILKQFNDDGVLPRIRISKYKNPHLVRAALATLVSAKVVCLKGGVYTLSELGKQLASNIGLITVPLNGYRKLFAKQYALLDAPPKKNSDIDFSELVLASIDFGMNDINPLIMSIFKEIKPKGTICDLGCGTGERLVKVCRAVNAPGLGIESSNQAIAQSKKYTKECPNLEVIKGDIARLGGVWEDVEVAMMSFVCHDICPALACVRMLRSFRNHFPRMRHLMIVDIVSPSAQVPTIMPGFDYVHGLQGMTPRNYEETLEVFKRAGYAIVQEHLVPNMPNTFIWLLIPNGCSS